MADEHNEIESLKDERDRLAVELLSLRGQVAAEKGPARGTVIHYVKAGDKFSQPCRFGKLISDGFTARVKAPGGTFDLHCHLEYGEHPSIKHRDPKTGELSDPVHTWEVDRAWSPLGAPDSWHLPQECPYGGVQAP